MGIFGWSYPPGCSGPPDDDDAPCEVCGKMPDDCICPECPECGEVGNPKCYLPEQTGHELIRTPEQIEGRKVLDAYYEKEAQAERDADV